MFLSCVKHPTEYKTVTSVQYRSQPFIITGYSSFHWDTLSWDEVCYWMIFVKHTHINIHGKNVMMSSISCPMNQGSLHNSQMARRSHLWWIKRALHLPSSHTVISPTRKELIIIFENCRSCNIISKCPEWKHCGIFITGTFALFYHFCPTVHYLFMQNYINFSR